MGGYGIEVDEDGSAFAYGSNLFRELGVISRDPVLGWSAKSPGGKEVLEVRVNDRYAAVRALARASGLGEDYVVRWPGDAAPDETWLSD